MSAALVIGARGQLGREVVARLLEAGREVAARTHEELDALYELGCRRELRRIQPGVVVDCTAVRPQPRDGIGQIAEAATNVAVAARAVGAFTIYLSCAEVFDGNAEEPYVESDRPQPVTDFGVAKLEAEQAVAVANERHALVRTSWLFGPGGTNIIEAILSAADESDTVPVEAATKSCPTYAAHLAEALVGLVERPAYGVFHAAGAGSATKLQLAHTVLRMARSAARAVALTDSGGSMDARNLVLESRRDEISRLPEWQIGVSLYLEARTRASVR